MATDGMQLARFLAKTGVGSRRACEELILSGEIAVNGQRVTDPATRIDPERDRVTHSGQRVSVDAPLYMLLHKPAGYTCTAADPHAEKLAVSLLKLAGDHRVFSIGRLDRDSEGLLLFTNDGDLANRLLHPRHGVQKTYRAIVKGRVRPEALAKLESGIMVERTRFRAIKARMVAQIQGGAELEIVLAEGKKREVRRMCEAIGCKVVRLLRTSFGPVKLGRFRPGYQRNLTPAEVAALRAAAGLK